MSKFIFTILSTALVSSFAFASAPAAAGRTRAIQPSQNEMDFGIVAGAFAPKPKTVKAGGTKYTVIAPDLIEPACNSTQIVIWVSDENLPGDAGGVAYNLGVQANKLVSVKAVNGEVEIVYKVGRIDDCATFDTKTAYVKYPGAAGPLSIR